MFLNIANKHPEVNIRLRQSVDDVLTMMTHYAIDYDAEPSSNSQNNTLSEIVIRQSDVDDLVNNAMIDSTVRATL